MCRVDLTRLGRFPRGAQPLLPRGSRRARRAVRRLLLVFACRGSLLLSPLPGTLLRGQDAIPVRVIARELRQLRGDGFGREFADRELTISILIAGEEPLGKSFGKPMRRDVEFEVLSLLDSTWLPLSGIGRL